MFQKKYRKSKLTHLNQSRSELGFELFLPSDLRSFDSTTPSLSEARKVIHHGCVNLISISTASHLRINLFKNKPMNYMCNHPYPNAQETDNQKN